MFIHIYNTYMYTYIHTHMHIYTYYKHIHTHTHIYLHPYMHTYIMRLIRGEGATNVRQGWSWKEWEEGFGRSWREEREGENDAILF